jgi:hypothetical protein
MPEDIICPLKAYLGELPSYDLALDWNKQKTEEPSKRRCQSNGGSSTRRAHALFQMTIYAARARHSANAAERLCL